MNTTRYARIAVNVPQISGLFDYHLPADMAAAVRPGCLVEVPFGKQQVQGIVLSIENESTVLETRPVHKLLDMEPVLTPRQMQLAAWMAEHNLSTLAEMLGLMLPPGMSQQGDTNYRLAAPGEDQAAAALSALQRRVLDEITRRGTLRGRQLAAAFPHQNWKEAAQALVRKGWLTSEAVLLPPAVRPKINRRQQVELIASAGRIAAQNGALGRAPASERRQAILNYLLQEGKAVEPAWLYAQTNGTPADVQYLAKLGLVAFREGEVLRDPLAALTWAANEPPPLTAEQAAVWQSLQGGLNHAAQGKKTTPYLLYGVTGSGKTEIYLHAVEETLRQGRQAIILVPEIALTPQTTERFFARFPAQVGLIHSRLSAGERYDTWRRARAGAIPIIVGPRSALFTPLPNLGLIIIDECHDPSYDQEDLPPAYHAIPAAIEYARLTGSAVLLGSATPGVEQLYQAQHEDWTVLRLPARILAHREAVRAQLQANGLPAPVEGEVTTTLQLPPIQLVDMRQELKAGNSSMFSRPLQQALGDVLAREQQAILFLNRRGGATYIFCRACGEVLKCPRCDLPLTQHTQGQILLCHTCGYRRQPARSCPHCGSTQFREYGAGTERVEKEVQRLFPAARVLRWDAETASKKGAADVLMSHLVQHRADILVGTQMLAKGLDAPLVTLVGVMLADVGLALPDFRAGERTFQLLAQVAGRAGRSPLGGQVILQTYQPDHYVIRAAASYDFEGFSAYELNARKKMGYPPFNHLVRLEYRSPDAAEAQAAAQQMAGQLRHWVEQGGYTATEINGPTPCFYARQNGQYRWQILLRGPQPWLVLRERPLGSWRAVVDPPDLL